MDKMQNIIFFTVYSLSVIAYILFQYLAIKRKNSSIFKIYRVLTVAAASIYFLCIVIYTGNCIHNQIDLFAVFLYCLLFLTFFCIYSHTEISKSFERLYNSLLSSLLGFAVSFLVILPVMTCFFLIYKYLFCTNAIYYSKYSDQNLTPISILSLLFIPLFVAICNFIQNNYIRIYLSIQCGEGDGTDIYKTFYSTNIFDIYPIPKINNIDIPYLKVLYSILNDPKFKLNTNYKSVPEIRNFLLYLFESDRYNINTLITLMRQTYDYRDLHNIVKNFYDVRHKISIDIIADQIISMSNPLNHSEIVDTINISNSFNDKAHNEIEQLFIKKSIFQNVINGLNYNSSIQEGYKTTLALLRDKRDIDFLNTYYHELKARFKG